MELGEFQLDSVKLKTECERKYTTGKFSCLEGEFLLTRSLGYYILQIILPSVFLISCTVGSFWVKLQVAPARVFLSVVAIYSCISWQATANRGIPKVSYVKVRFTKIILCYTEFRPLTFGCHSACVLS